MEIYLNGRGEYEAEVQGESAHQSFLKAACGGRKEYSAKHRNQPQLRIEGKRVAVILGDTPVGVLADKDADALLAYLTLAGYRDASPISCEGMIVGGWDRGGGDRGAFGVRVVLPGEVVEGPPCWPDGSRKIPRI